MTHYRTKYHALITNRKTFYTNLLHYCWSNWLLENMLRIGFHTDRNVLVELRDPSRKRKGSQGWISDMGIDGPTFVPKSG